MLVLVLHLEIHINENEYSKKEEKTEDLLEGQLQKGHVKPALIKFFTFILVTLLLLRVQLYSMDNPTVNIATFAGGCFWCIEPPFVAQEGVLSVFAGYIGGTTKNPTYEDVISGKTGHIEAVQVTFDPKIVSYNELVSIFWRQIDPTDPDGQFADKGSQYITAIFYHNETQKQDAEASKEAIIKQNIFNGTIVTKIIPASIFYIAEDYHQQYYKKNPEKYKRYRFFSGRESFLKSTWEEK